MRTKCVYVFYKVFGRWKYIKSDASIIIIIIIVTITELADLRGKLDVYLFPVQLTL